MTTLTKEYFDRHLQTFRQEVTGAFKKQTKELKIYADEQTQKVATIIAETIADPLEKLKKTVDRHDKDIKAIKEAIRIH